jgi:Ca2+/Na+ antiporter
MEQILIPSIFFLVILFALADTSTDEQFDKYKIVVYLLILVFLVFTVKALVKNRPENKPAPVRDEALSSIDRVLKR